MGLLFMNADMKLAENQVNKALAQADSPNTLLDAYFLRYVCSFASECKINIHKKIHIMRLKNY